MEERPAGAAAAANDDDPQRTLPPQPPPGAFYHETEDGTYVVQVPKDQIYRVPPPENAAIADRYRNPTSSSTSGKKTKRPPCRFRRGILYCAGSLLAVALALYIAYLIVGPKDPEFAVLQVLLANPPSSSPPSRRESMEFLISLEATNPNARLGVCYGRGGEAALFFKRERIATGEFLPGRLCQEENNSTVVRVALKSAGLPREIKRSASNGIEMGLTVEVPVRMRLGAAKTWWMDMSVACTFKVSALGKDGHVTGQQCQTSVKS